MDKCLKTLTKQKTKKTNNFKKQIKKSRKTTVITIIFDGKL
jgi:hypothetical protein